MKLRLAEASDEKALRDLSGTSMEGRISLRITSEPSYFQAIRVHGEDPRVVVGEEDGRIRALGVVARRRVYVEGKPRDIGYLCGLRIAPEARRGTLLARGYRFFQALHLRELGVPYYLTAILEGNAGARQALTSGRAGLPAYVELGRYQTCLIPTGQRAGREDTGTVTFAWGRDGASEEALRCQEQYGARRNYFPVPRRDSWARGETGVPGLSQGDHLVARTGREPAGTLALWDQRAFRQVRVTLTSTWTRWAWKIARSAGRLLRTSRLPRPGEPVPFAFVARVALREEDPDLFGAMLDEARREAAARGIAFPAAGFFEGDPLLEAARARATRLLASRIYRVTWRRETLGENARVPFLELGSL